MKKWMDWLAKRYLTEWVRVKLEREIRHLVEKNEDLQQEVDRLNAYIDGMEQGMKMRTKIFLQSGEHR